MPAHDWTRVSQGIFHHFHNAWIQQLTNALNDGILPPNYYALSEQVIGKAAPHVIALELVPPIPVKSEHGNIRAGGAGAGATVAQRAPRTTITEKAANVTYASLRKTIVVRHVEGHEVVALVEILSRANKASRAELEAFLRKAQGALKQHIHLLVVDLYPPGRLDPSGIHGELWSALGQSPFQLPEGKDRVAAAYESGEEITAYVEPFGVGNPLPEMPLFLAAGFYVEAPLESTYQAAFGSVPRYWREKVAN